MKRLITEEDIDRIVSKILSEEKQMPDVRPCLSGSKVIPPACKSVKGVPDPMKCLMATIAMVKDKNIITCMKLKIGKIKN